MARTQPGLASAGPRRLANGWSTPDPAFSRILGETGLIGITWPNSGSDLASVRTSCLVAVITFQGPEVMKAIQTRQDCVDIIEALESLVDDRNISAAIVTGSGRAFSVGVNLPCIKDRVEIGPLEEPDSTRFSYRRGVQRITEAFMACEIPLIAAVNGHTIGLGCDLACQCDLRIAAESAKFAASFIQVGIVSGDGGAWTLQKAIGYSRAAEMFLTGHTYSAVLVEAFGLVNTVMPDDLLMAEAMNLAQSIAADPARALRLTKRLLCEAQTQRMSEILELSAAFQSIAHETADHAEAVGAFLEKRKPGLPASDRIQRALFAALHHRTGPICC